jgi:hypothetical protein
MCNMQARWRIYAARAQARELNLLVLRGEPLDSDQVALLSNGLPIHSLW